MIREIIMGGLILLGYYRTKEDSEQAKAMRSQKEESLLEQGAFDYWSGPIIVGGPSPQEILRRSLVIIGE